MRPVLRLALRDASRHRGRSALALAVIALPIAMVLLLLSAMTPATTGRDAALASLPDGTDGVVTATASADPLLQLPEALPQWIDEQQRLPATTEQISTQLPSNARLLEWWNSPTLIMTTGLATTPGEQDSAHTAALVNDLDAAALSTLELREGSVDTLELLLPELLAGTAPVTAEEIVISRAAAESAGLEVGDSLQLLAPPDTGWRSTDGRVGAVVEDTVRGYRVAGIAESAEAQAWALPEWIAPLVTEDQAGVDRHFLLTDASGITWEQIKNLNRDGVGVISRAVLEDYPPRHELHPTPVDPQQLLTQAAVTGLTVAGVAVLLVLLVTPAFTVGAERMRRTFGLAIANGARPRDVSGVLLGQGAVIGLVGSALGVLLALGGIPLLRAVLAGATGPAFGPLHWSLPLLLLVAGPALGAGATFLPARRVARIDPIEALTERLPSTGARRTSPLLALVGGIVAGLGAAILLGAALAPAPLSVILLLPGALALLTGALLLLPGLLGFCEAIASMFRGGVMLRLAARDAVRHIGRTGPAAAAILVSVGGLAILATTSGSFHASRALESTSMVAPGRATIGMETPISDDVDRSIIESVLEQLETDGLVYGHVPVHSAVEGAGWIEAAPAPGMVCPEGQGPDVHSAVNLDAPLQCVPLETSYQPGLSFPSWLGNQLTVMSPDDLRATGFPGADEAAAVLGEGGAVVNDATRLAKDGTVELSLVPSEEGLGTVPGVFLPGFEPYVTISHETARAWGLETRYVGEIIEPTEELNPRELARLREAATDVTPVVQVSGSAVPGPLGLTSGAAMTAVFFVGGTALAIVAALLSIALGRKEADADLTTMQALGITPKQRRRYGISQAGVLLLAGVPTGLLVGLLTAAALVDTGLLEFFLTFDVLTVPLLGSLTLLVVLVGTGALMQSRPRDDLPRRPN